MKTSHFIKIFTLEELIQCSKTSPGRDQICIALAQWNGWDYQYYHLGGLYGFAPPEWRKNHDPIGANPDIYELPPYTRSLDAVAEVLHALPVYQRVRWQEWVYKYYIHQYKESPNQENERQFCELQATKPEATVWSIALILTLQK